MKEKHFISAILPLKLEWEPCYVISEKVDVGDRVKVGFAGKEYIAVVSAIDIEPRIGKERIRPVISIETGISKILREEIELWRQISSYYLCTIEEVYKAAYPIGKLNMEEARAAARQKVTERKEKIISSIISRLEKLRARLENKTRKAEKAKEGTKTKSALLEDIKRIQDEIIRSEDALESASSELKAANKVHDSNKLLSTDDNIILNIHQSKALEETYKGFAENKPVLLHGVTGSGKTEIYIRLAVEAISKGKNVLYLVPEIALSRQLEDRLYKHFGDRLLTFHSGESSASRRDSAEIIRDMTPEKGGYIALCTRSGIFLPHHDLGLIIVDEEHDNSYKQDSPAPRYNGRDTALMLHRIHKGCNIILGSATPSLEEIYNSISGRHYLVELKERFHGSADSDIEIIDTKAERRKRGMEGNFSRKLIEHINHTLAEGGQILILRSRRAWSSVLQCESCGEIQKCPHCNVSLSYHKSGERMTCHYCGYSLPYTGSCSKCNGKLHGLGAGTQRIEEEASALFPQARIARLDSDTAQNRSYESKTIKEFSKGNIDILIGTQIIAKGFDFERLTMVAVIAADTLLGIQDFRADEKAMHLLEQFRGRCGRRDRKGLLVIQTSQPEHPIYKNIMANTPDSFNQNLLTERKDFSFPPYTRILELTIRDIYEDRAERMSIKLSMKLQQYAPTGPYIPVIDKVADKYIRKIRLSLKKDKNLSANKKGILNTIREFEKENRYDSHITIDVDPA